jgi:hypothetical protein
MAFLVMPLALGAAFFIFKSRTALAPENFAGRSPASAFRPIEGIIHSMHAIPEFLLLGNLGLDSETTTTQGVTMTLVLVASWFWFRRGGASIAPLEAAGAVLLAASYLLVYTVRGYLPFASLRGIPWYHTLPHLGAVLFVFGLFAGISKSKEMDGRPTLGGVAGIFAFAVVMCVLHNPAAERKFLASTFPTTHEEVSKALVPESLRRTIPLEVAMRVAQDQRRMLAQLDRVETVSRQLGLDRHAIRDAVGRLQFPGMSESFDALDMLNLPTDSNQVDPRQVREALNWLETGAPTAHPAIRPLIDALADPNPDTRSGAAFTLGLFGPLAKPAVTALVKSLRDPDLSTKLAAAQALRRIDPRIAAELGIDEPSLRSTP